MMQSQRHTIKNCDSGAIGVKNESSRAGAMPTFQRLCSFAVMLHLTKNMKKNKQNGISLAIKVMGINAIVPGN